jgi:hypothetical protein
MTSASTTSTKPSAAQIEQARKRRFRGMHSTPAQLELIKAGSPMGQMREKHRGKIVRHCHHRCFVCRRFVGSGGGCSGVRQGSAASTPACHVDAASGKMQNPMVATAAGGLRLAAGQDEHWMSTPLNASGRAVVTAPRGT